MNGEKSLLDGVPVDNRAFPLGKATPVKLADELSVVGNCPTCGAPIYGSPKVAKQGAVLEVTFACSCHGARTINDLTCKK